MHYYFLFIIIKYIHNNDIYLKDVKLIGLVHSNYCLRVRQITIGLFNVLFVDVLECTFIGCSLQWRAVRFVYFLNNMDIQFVNTRRKILNHVICSILVECGYDTCDKQALETLTEMLQSCRFLS